MITFNQFNCKNSWTQISTFYLTVSRTSWIFLIKLEVVILIFLSHLKSKLCRHHKRYGWTSAQKTFTCPKSAIETLEKFEKYVQSEQ